MQKAHGSIAQGSALAKNLTLDPAELSRTMITAFEGQARRRTGAPKRRRTASGFKSRTLRWDHPPLNAPLRADDVRVERRQPSEDHHIGTQNSIRSFRNPIDPSHRIASRHASAEYGPSS